MDTISRLDLFQIGRAYVLARARKIDPAQIDTQGSDANLFVGSTSFMGSAVNQQLASRVNALFLDGANRDDLDRYAFDRYQLPRKGAAPARVTVSLFRPTVTVGAGSFPLGGKVRSLTGIEYVTTEVAVFGATTLSVDVKAKAVQSGKCLDPLTPVLRYDGSIVAAKDVREGDLLMGPDSNSRRVLATTKGRGELFRIVPKRGDPWVCNDVHILTVIDTTTGKVVDIGLDEFLDRSPSWRADQKLFIAGVDFPAIEDPPIDPYFLGIWFGDGTKYLGRGPEVSKPDAEIRQACVEVARQWGLEVKTIIGESGCPKHMIQSRYPGDPNPLLRAMRELVGDAETLPKCCLVGSRRVRAAFLAGLLDTDGSIEKPGAYEIMQKRRAYADGLAFVARSLGYRATMKPKVVGGTTYWRLRISGVRVDELPMRIPRKIVRELAERDARRTGFEVHAIGIGDYAGFTLDRDGRFLLGDFTVTHNSFQVGRNQLRSVVGAFDPSIQANNVNPAAGGENTEDDVDFRERVRDYWATARRGTLGAISFGARAVSGVTSAVASEALNGGGQPARIVNMAIADSSGVANAALAAEVQTQLLEFRAAGIQVLLSTSIPQIVDLALQLSFASGVDTTTVGEAIRAAVFEFVNSLPVSGTLYRQELGALLQRFRQQGLLPGQDTIVAPVGDLVPAPGTTLRTTLANISLL